MNDNVRKVFDMLGVEPNEIFKVDGYDYKYYIDDNLEIYAISPNPYAIIKFTEIFMEIIKNPERIIKLPKKKKLRDLTKDEWDKWKRVDCVNCLSCDDCIFENVSCTKSSSLKSWFNNKDLYSDKFLNQEIEVEE